MTDVFISRLSNQLAGRKSAGLYKSERVITSMVGLDRGRRRESAELLRQQLPRPRRQRRPARGGQPDARPLRLRNAFGSLHLRHSGRGQAPRGDDLLLPRVGGHDPLWFLLRRQWRFEMLLGEEDAIISDALNHASIIYGAAVEGRPISRLA